MISHIHPSKPRRPNVVESTLPLQAVRLLDQVRERIRDRHYSYRTEPQYVYCVCAFVRFHGVRHPLEIGAANVERFLTWPAVERKVVVSTHKQAFSAEKRAVFVADALASRAEAIESGQGFSATEAHAYMTARVSGKTVNKPQAASWRG